MRIFNINIYRDGGSIEFYIEHDGRVRQVWLETPFSGEPRALRIDDVVVGRADPAVAALLADIEEWWTDLSPDVRQRVVEVMERKGPFYDPDAKISHAIDLSRIRYVRDYVAQTYAG
jgi:hypothetical protein